MRLWWPLFVVAFMQIHHEIMGFFNDNCQFCSSGPQPTIARQRNDDVHPHVDIFYLVINNPQLEYISKGRFWVLPTMAMVYSRLIPNHKQNGVSFNVTRDSNASTIIDNGRDTRVHIVTDHLPIIQQAQKLGLYAHDIKEYLAQLPKHIVKNVHDGTTSVEYEVTFLRWIVFNRIVQQWNGQWVPSQSLRPIERILVLDLDAMLTYNAASYFHFSIVALTNASLSEPTSYSPDSFDYVNVALGAISLFSVPGLANFSQEVYSFFDDADAVVVNKRCKAFHPNFSDMMFLKWFIARNPSRRSVCYEYDPGYQCLLARLGCVPISNYKDMLNHPDRKLEFHVRDESVITWTKNHPHLSKLAADHRPPDFHLYADWQHAPVCAIHFQGRENKYLFYVFARAFFASYFRHHPLLKLYDFQEPMVWHQKGSRLLVHISNSSHREPITSMDHLSSLGFTTRDVTLNVPGFLIQFMPLSHSHSSQNSGLTRV